MLYMPSRHVKPLSLSWPSVTTILLLIASNTFMTFAWYGHLKFKQVPLWQAILASHFLLEPDRDYELRTHCSLDDEQFVLSCSFLSACGRYAFWRLVNRQAPEAEQKLNGHLRVSKLNGSERRFYWVSETMH